MSEKYLIAPDAPQTVNILLVDDHLLLLDAISAVLSAHEGFVVTTVSDVDGALAKIAEHGSYDVILLDYHMPGMDALEGLRVLIEANDGRVALLSGVASWAVVDRAVDLGAVGFIPKSSPIKNLVHAVRFIADGEIYLPTEYMRRGANGGDNGIELKPREMQVLTFLCQGLQNKEIGRELGLDEVIVKMDVKSICRKLNVRNRTAAVVEAAKRALV